MKTFRKILIGLLVLLAIVAIVSFIAVRYVSHNALPDYSEGASLKDLKEEVSVYRDERAVPHVYAKNEHDLYMVTGYLMAQDRLWQMDLLRRVTLGRLSEIFGEDKVNTDHLLRALRMTKKSQMVLDQSDAVLLENLNAFTNGINQFIETHQKKLPPEFLILGYKPEPWQPIHTLNLIGYMAWDLAGSWQNEIYLHKLRQKLDEEMFSQLLPDLDYQKTYVFPDLEEKNDTALFSMLDGNQNLQELGLEIFNGSNNWAISGKKSTSGKALMAGDMHLGFGAPGIWYQMHQVVEGQMNVTGVALPGAPMIICGHNEYIAWGMTNLYVDEMDFYAETLNPNNPEQYLFNDEWKDMEVIQESIITKKGDTILRENKFTHRGPIISDFKKLQNEVLSMRWTGNDFSDELRSIYLLNHAKNWDDFRNALRTMGAVSQNIVYADVEGNIGMQSCGAVPVRNDGEGIFIYSGTTEQYDWTGTVPFDELPSTYNPSDGHVSSANNRIIGDDYPYYIGNWFDNSARIDRIREMLNEKEKLGIQDFMDMQSDQQSSFVKRYLDDLVSVIKNSNNLSSNEQKALEKLTGWDAVMDRDSVAPLVFEKFYYLFLKNTIADEMGETLFSEFGSGLIRHAFDHLWRNQGSIWFDNVLTSEKETFEAIVLKSYHETIQSIETTQGADLNFWKWSDVHQLTLNHPMGKVKMLDRIFGFNKGPFPVGGSFHTVSACGYNIHTTFNAIHGASQRHIYNPADWNDSYVVIPTGTSGIPASNYYCDQAEMYIGNHYFHDLFSREDVENKARYKAVFLTK